ncbi:MAG: DNA repair protein RecO [Lachnospiraceae bacterium]|nr:DNA repair protein RecO [Lachnospiraceae bacterium]
MQDFLTVTGMIIGAFPQGEYDRRVTLLTKDQGKITAFVKGARRQGSRFTANTDLFIFGEFDLYVGKNSYTVQDARPLNYFEFLRNDLNASFYGMYFLEICDYYGRENNPEAMLLLNLYRAIQGLKSEKLDNKFVKAVFELKTFVIEGELIPPEALGEYKSEVISAVNYITNSSIEKLYSFALSEEGTKELSELADKERRRIVDRHLKSLDILEMMAE